MPAKPGSTQIGFVGLGIMGAPMALKLIEAGFSWDEVDALRSDGVIGPKREVPS